MTISNLAAVALLASLLTPPCALLHAQEPKPPPDFRLGVSVGTFRHERNDGGKWKPAAGLAARLRVGRGIVGEVSVVDARTRRTRWVVCPDELGVVCPPPEAVSGSSTVLIASLGLEVPLGGVTAVPHLGFGHMWDFQPYGMIRHGGPTWAAGVRVERRLDPRFGLEAGYRVLRMSRERDYGDRHLVHHELSVGLSVRPSPAPP